CVSYTEVPYLFPSPAYGMPETIYSLVPHVPDVPVKPPMYKSRHDPVCVLAGSTFGSFGTTQPIGAAMLKKQASGTFGPPVEALRNDPAKFLKKGTKTHTGTGGSGDKKNSDGDATSKKGPAPAFTYPGERKAMVPRRDNCPVTGIASKANFVTANAVDTILAVPRRVDLEPVNYLEKEDYGKVPKYLQQVKSEITRENAMIDTFVREQMGLEVGDDDDHLEELRERERTELLHALKAKWDTVNKKYQLMAHMVNLDTFGKLRRKEQMETQLKGLEKDIEKLEKTPVLICP
ncbi:unnamed protein product, partial [Ectocarpus sp. 12 AP-2014]